MRITGFFVNNFGIFSGGGADLSKGLTVIHGENESGKTTLMNFFRRILFPREKGARFRGNTYDPVLGGNHGGTARIRMEDGRQYLLTLDGTRNTIAPVEGGVPDDLSPDFFSISREVYENVFAMGLAEMQSLQPINSSGVTSRFFAAGAGLGSASLPKLLSSLEAGANELYRPGANARSASAVNRLLAALEETDSGIRNLRELDGEWRQKKKDLLALERSMEEKKKKLASLNARLSELELLEKGRAAWKAVREAEERLGELEGLHPFPGNGLARLERLKDEKERLQRAIEGTQEDIRRKKEERSELGSDPLLRCLECKEEIKNLDHESERFRSALSRRALLEKETGAAERIFLQNLENLCPWWTGKDLDSADVSAEAIAFAREKAARKAQLEKRKGEEEKSLAQWNRLLEDRRSEASSLDRELSKVEVRAWRALDRWKLITHVRDVFGELRDEESELAKLEDARKNLARERTAAAEQEPDAPGKLVAGISAVLLAVSGGAAYQWHLTSDRVWSIGGAALLCASALAFIAHRDQERRHKQNWSWWKRRVEEMDVRMEETMVLLDDQIERILKLQARMEDLTAKLGIKVPGSDSDVDALLEEGEKDNAANERFAMLTERSRQIGAVVSRMDTEAASMEWEIERIDGELQDLVSEWEKWVSLHGFDRSLAPGDMEAMVPRILQLRSEKNGLDARKGEMNEIGEYIGSVRKRIGALSTVFADGGMAPPESPDESAIRSLADILGRASAKKGEISALEREIQSLCTILERQRSDSEAVDRRTEELFSSAGADGEESFRELAMLWEERERLQSAKHQEQKVLGSLFGQGDGMFRAQEILAGLPVEECRKEMDSLNASSLLLEKEIEALAVSRGRAALQAEQIASDERLGDLLFTRKSMETKLDGYLGEWLSAVLARHFLEAARERHERERQPEVICLAGKYLALMTEGRYTLLSRGGEKGFSVLLESSGPSRERKEEEKWSSGLADQVYLSMRLALASLWGRKSEPLPLILDDLLVRFDEGRQRGAAEAVLEAAGENQVLLFTCQKNTLHIFRSLAEEKGLSPDRLSFQGIRRGTFLPA